MGNSKLSSNGLKIAQVRYFLENVDKDWEDVSRRIGRGVGRVENGNSQVWEDKFSNMIYEMDFLPGGRIIRNVGRNKGSLFNCFVIPIEDSIEEIGQFLKDSLTLWSEGGGIGTNFSNLRPRGAIIKGKGGNSSGPVSFLEAADAVASTIESGGQRRAAGLACMNVSHPDILEFIDAKIVHGKISHFNLSVLVDEEFLEAVESDGLWEFKFAQQSMGTIKARIIWDKIISNMIKHAEPGLLNWDNMRSNNSYYYDPVISTNPCITGDTMVYVADGRRYVAIKTLAEEDKDVPVFCFNEQTHKPEVKMMRRPRITGRNKKILKVNLDDGSSVRCTENHKFYMKDGSIKRADELVMGDRLHHMVSYHASLEEIFKGSNSRSADYVWLNTDFSATLSEHRLVAEFSLGRKLKTGELIHHKDYNSLNNAIDNLVVMTKKEHDILHTKDMLGENNPMNRFPEKNWLIKQDWSDSNNGRFKGYTPEQVFDIAVKYSIELKRKATQEEWYEYCRSHGLPNSRYSLGNYSSPSKMLLAAAEKAGVVALQYSAHVREYKKYLELLTETDMDIFFEDGSIYVNKLCDMCGEIFSVVWWNRERAFCSRACSSRYAHSNEEHRTNKLLGYANRQQETRVNQIKLYSELKKRLNRAPMKKEWEKVCKNAGISYRIRSKKEKNFNEHCFISYKELQQAAELNFVVVSIEEDGYDDVYNGTVDGNHNFYFMVSEDKTKTKKIKYNNMLCRQCGEVILESYGSCNLGSLVLPNFITGTINTNWKKLEETIKLAVRFLDNVIELNKYSLKQNDIKAHNSRRIGIGVMGMAEYLFAKKLKYGSKKSVEEIERLMRFIRDIIYETSVELSVEKGAFPKFDSVAYGKAHFVRTLPAKLRMDIKDKGIRNVTCMALAPTGTISLLPEVSSGIEPLFKKAYRRNDRVSERIYVHPIYKGLLEKGEDIPEWFVDSEDIKPEDHFEIQAVSQKYVDSAVSKCISHNTRIETQDGLIKISDTNNNRILNSFSEINLSVMTEDKIETATSFYYNGFVKKGLKIITSNGFFIEGTENHNIRCLNENHEFVWKKLSDLKIDDILPIKINTCIVDSSKNRSIANILKKEFVFEQRYIKKVNVPNKISSDLCWWLGCLISDGSLISSTYTISFCQTGGEVLDKFVDITRKLFNIDCYIIRDNRRENLFNVIISSIKLFSWLNEYIGFNKDEIPELIFRSGKLMRKNFIEGITLDGFVSDDHICIKTDKSENFISQLQLLCASIGIPTYINQKYNSEYDKYYYNLFVQEDGILEMLNFSFPEKHKEIKLNKIINSKSLVRRKSFIFNKDLIPINNEFIMLLDKIENRCLDSSRLYNIFYHIKNNAKKQKALTLDSLLTVYSFIDNIPKIFNDDILFTKVKKIDTCEIETMDIEVLNGHNYIANGFISHNTINMPKETTSEELSRLTLEYIHDLKGVTIYVDESREGQVLNKISNDEVKNYLKTNESEKIIIYANSDDVKCSSGTCEI